MTIAAWRSDRVARLAERALRLAADPRLGIALLVLAAAANALAAIAPALRPAVESPVYLGLLGAVLLAGLAALAVRAPAAWREWRRPGPIGGRRSSEATGDLELSVVPDASPPTLGQLADLLHGAGYRVAAARGAVHGVRRGWSRLAGQGVHAALVLLVAGAGLSGALGSEVVFSLLPGDQAPLGEPSGGETAAVRLEALDAEFGADGRPRRLDTTVTFLRAGEPISTETLQVNRPGSFDGYLLHGWTYGPAVRLRVASLAGRPLLDAAVALDEVRGGRPAGAAELPTAGGVLGLVLADAAANELLVGFVEGGELRDAVLLRPRAEARVGSVTVRLDSFTSYVTFLSRRDPGAGLVFGGAALLVVGLGASLWLPRRRATLLVADGSLRLVLRGERFDDVRPELARLRLVLARALGLQPAMAR